MQRLNESWSHIISSTKVYAQNIQVSFNRSEKFYSLIGSFQETLKRNKIIQEEIRELEDWIQEKERGIAIDDGAIYYQEQLRERLEQYQVKFFSRKIFFLNPSFCFSQKLQTELNLKEYTVRTLVDQARHDISQSSSPELSHSLDTLISNWSSLQKKVDQKLAFYTDIYKLHEELKGI